jgi:hypothetical protein
VNALLITVRSIKVALAFIGWGFFDYMGLWSVLAAYSSLQGQNQDISLYLSHYDVLNKIRFEIWVSSYLVTWYFCQ